MAFGALQNFAPPILERMYGVTLTFAASGLTAYLLGNAAGIAAGGFFARGEHQERLVAAALSFAACCAVLLASGAVPGWSIVALMGLMGFGSGFTGPSRDILVRRAATSAFGVSAYGRVYGFVYSGIDTGLALAPIAFGEERRRPPARRIEPLAHARPGPNEAPNGWLSGERRLMRPASRCSTGRPERAIRS